MIIVVLMNSPEAFSTECLKAATGVSGAGAGRGASLFPFSFENGFDLLANAVHPVIVANCFVDVAMR